MIHLFLKVALIFNLTYFSHSSFSQDDCVTYDGKKIPISDDSSLNFDCCQRSNKGSKDPFDKTVVALIKWIGMAEDESGQLIKDVAQCVPCVGLGKTTNNPEFPDDRSRDFSCCPGLTSKSLNSTSKLRVCKDDGPALPPEMKECTQDSECEGNLSCLPSTISDIFHDKQYKGTERRVEIEQAYGKITSFYHGENVKNHTWESYKSEIKRNHKLDVNICSANFHCDSFKCNTEDFLCINPRNVCRKGKLDETVKSNGACISPFVNEGNKCVKSAEHEFETYMGLVDVGLDSNSCDAALIATDHDRKQLREEEFLASINSSLKSIRAMEWVFITMGEDDECLRLGDFTRQCAGALRDERIKSMDDFQHNFGLYEKAAATLDEYSEKANAEVIDIAFPKFDPGETRARPVDLKLEMSNTTKLSLELDKFKYQLFKIFETNLANIYNNQREKFEFLNKHMATTWKSDSESWLLAENWRNQGNDGPCDYWYDFFWGGYGGLRDSWNSTIEIDPRENGYIEYLIKEVPLAVDYVAKITGLNDPVVPLLYGADPCGGYEGDDEFCSLADESKSEVKILDDGSKDWSGYNYHSLGNTIDDNYFLIDPLFPGNNSIANPVWDEGSASFKYYFWLSSSRKDYDVLAGDERPFFRDLHQRFNAHKNFINSFTELLLSKNPLKEIIDPELLPAVPKGCLNAINSPSPESKNFVEQNCKPLKNYLKEIEDVGLAQFWAYSAAKYGHYEDFHDHDKTLRRQLYKDYEVSLTNLVDYYDKLVMMRDIRIACIDLVLKENEGLSDQGGLSGSSSGGAGTGASGAGGGASGAGGGAGGAGGGDSGSGGNGMSGPLTTDSSRNPRAPYSSDNVWSKSINSLNSADIYGGLNFQNGGGSGALGGSQVGSKGNLGGALSLTDRNAMNDRKNQMKNANDISDKKGSSIKKRLVTSRKAINRFGNTPYLKGSLGQSSLAKLSESAGASSKNHFGAIGALSSGVIGGGAGEAKGKGGSVARDSMNLNKINQASSEDLIDFKNNKRGRSSRDNEQLKNANMSGKNDSQDVIHSNEKNSLFDILSNAYGKNLHKILERRETP